ncbi:hypothetical protein Y59_10790 [Enterobacter hormaechei]|nr:hypothetical protein Y59_10790 [Enterobacter hormaechei]
MKFHVKSGSLREKNHPATLIFAGLCGYFSPVSAQYSLTGFAGGEAVINNRNYAVKGVLCLNLIFPA